MTFVEIILAQPRELMKYISVTSECETCARFIPALPHPHLVSCPQTSYLTVSHKSRFPVEAARSLAREDWMRVYADMEYFGGEGSAMVDDTSDAYPYVAYLQPIALKNLPSTEIDIRENIRLHQDKYALGKLLEYFMRARRTNPWAPRPEGEEFYRYVTASYDHFSVYDIRKTWERYATARGWM